MINNYEIRENSLTQNSVYVLLLSADEQGREDIERELADQCAFIDAKVPGFDYVYELIGVTDETLLEKIRTRIDFLSASVHGVTQTFGNFAKTLTAEIPTNMSVEDFKLKMTRTFTKQELEQQNTIKSDLPQNDQEKSSINLANTGFPLTQEPPDETNFKDIPADSTLVSGDEKRIDIGDTSLKIAETRRDIREDFPSNKNMPSVTDISQNTIKNMQDKEDNNVEAENKTIVSYSPEDMQNVSITMEKKKTGLFGSIFGKIKTAINSNKNIEEIKNKTKQLKDGEAFSNLINEAKEIKQEIVQNLEQKEKKKDIHVEKANPFQNLGEGIIVKKGLLDEEADVSSVRQELSANPVTARLQVDDIFAAETVCDFYDNSNKGTKSQDETVVEEKGNLLASIEKTPSVKQETNPINTSDNEEREVNSLPKQNSLPEEKPRIGNKVVMDNTQSTIGITLPEQIFTKNDFEKTVENTHSQSKLQEIEEKKAFDERKREETYEISNKNSIPQLPKEEETNNALQQDEKSLKEENKNMEEQHKMKPVVLGSQSNFQNIRKTAFVQSANKKTGMKIDHTLHVGTPSKDAKYRNYPIEMPLIPTYTFANMDISSVRFAHAMAMATLDDLGKVNNPFLLQGPSGTGKTHFLHAMGYEISKKIPQAKILFTNGVRFSRGIQYLLEQGQKDKLDNFFNNAEVLIIDDVHLTAVNENNREYISKVLTDFLQNKKQIILSSKYPPESLQRFEELVNFKFSAGAVAELKVPSRKHFEKLTNKILSSSLLDLTEKQVQTFFTDRLSSLGDVARDVKRVKVLNRRIESSGIKKMSYEEILNEMTSIHDETSESEIVKKDFSEITALERNKDISWGNFGFFFPVSQIDKFRWVAFATKEAAKELGIKGGFSYALKSSYSTEHIISSAFKIANICDLKGLKGAIILGPSFAECKEPIRDNFYDILTHMLEVMMIRCGTINFEDIKKPSAYVNLLGDILK